MWHQLQWLHQQGSSVQEQQHREPCQKRRQNRRNQLGIRHRQHLSIQQCSSVRQQQSRQQDPRTHHRKSTPQCTARECRFREGSTDQDRQGIQ